MSSPVLTCPSRSRESLRASKAVPVFVRRRPGHAHGVILALGHLRLYGVMGRSGFSAVKREGDGATPRATLRVIGGFFNPGRWPRAWGPVWMKPAKTDQGWCDAPTHARYNCPVRLPFGASHETLIRADRLYDAVVILDWNMGPKARHRGSAIFLHVMAQDGRPTAGCIALEPRDLARLLRLVRPGSRIVTRLQS